MVATKAMGELNYGQKIRLVGSGRPITAIAANTIRAQRVRFKKKENEKGN